jgi:RHS repeat-associated protein
VWLRDTPMAMFTPDPANPSGEPLVYFIHTDHLNTPRVVVDRQNRVRWRWLAEPFGTSAPETNPSGLGVFTQNLRFPGQYADAESGLFYNYFRYYNSAGGGYTQSDQIGLAGGSVSTYGYVEENPLGGTDPMGLSGVMTKVPGTNFIVRIDKPHVSGQETHAHIYDKNKNPITAVSQSGGSSHGSCPATELPKNPKLRDYLRARGIQVGAGDLLLLGAIGQVGLAGLGGWEFGSEINNAIEAHYGQNAGAALYELLHGDD